VNRDRSLDEFLDAADDETEGEDADDEADDGVDDAASEGPAGAADAAPRPETRDSEPEEAGTAEPAGSKPTDDGADEAVEGVGPAEPTYEWAPERRVCEDCGEAVERRWRAERDDGGMVCVDCKSW
jgi:hypothetical protein